MVKHGESCGGAESVLADSLAERLEPVTISAEPYISAAYARLEAEKVWRKVWQPACRVEDIEHVGDFSVYEVLDESIIVVRSREDKISAFYNVCAHRGRRLATGCGHTRQFRCPYHAWRYDLEGQNTYALDKDDWGDALTQERMSLMPVRVEEWAGFVWITMDPEAMSLGEYLGPAQAMLAPFELEKMRYRWRVWSEVPCNWKVALEAFLEPYHVEGTHPQLVKFQTYMSWNKAQGLHANSGYAQADDCFGNTLQRPGKGDDARISIAKLQDEIWDTVRGTTTQSFVDAAHNLVVDLPEGTPPNEVLEHWVAEARRADEDRGIIWPKIDPAHVAACGSSWHLFPNLMIMQSPNNAMYLRVLPHGYDPDRCIFETAVIELFPEGEAPTTEWVKAEDMQSDAWPPLLLQDFENMGEVQKGMHSQGFRGAIPNPRQEWKVSRFQEILNKFTSDVGPQPLRPSSIS